MKLTVLGSNGWFPANGQLTASYILEYKGTLIVIDAGTGIANFNLHTDILEKYDTVHVILSHYHFDHSVGIVYFNRWMTDKHLCFYFPAGKYYQSGAIGFENAIFAKGYNSGSLKGLAKRVSVSEYDENGFTINRIKIKTLALKHSNPSFALNFEDTVVMYSKELNNEYSKSIIEDIKNSVKIDQKYYRDRKWYTKFLQATYRLGSPIL